MTEKFTQEEEVMFRESFKKFDTEGSDYVSIDDIPGVLRAAGQAPTESEIEDYKKELDPKGNGEAKYKDVIELFGRIKKTALEMDDELTDAFKIFDKSLLGYISSSDLRKYMTTLGEKLTDEEVDEMIKDGDTANEGKINYTEFSYNLIHDNT